MPADSVTPFGFESLPVRGALIHLSRAWRRMLRDQIVRAGMTVRAAEELTRKLAAEARPSRRAGPKRDQHVVALEDRLRRELQTKVRIVGRPGRGRIEVHYYQPDELERITEILLGGL